MLGGSAFALSSTAVPAGGPFCVPFVVYAPAPFTPYEIKITTAPVGGVPVGLATRVTVAEVGGDLSLTMIAPTFPTLNAASGSLVVLTVTFVDSVAVQDGETA